ncbi:partial [Paramuricea clavata]|uniref:Partial n=1 Tax=Paramuricea clavata TaxID=317549 RepID=A0A7D9HE62_PARCT|nr:partial [Paramuricea clavata]
MCPNAPYFVTLPNNFTCQVGCWIKSINKIFNLWHISLFILKGDDINKEETPLLKAKSFREDENSTTEVRVLRSGRSTPVCIETGNGKEKSVSQKPVSQKKTKVKKPIKQGKELIKRESVTDSDLKSGFSSVKKEEQSDLLVEKNITITGKKSKAKAKTKKQLNKVGNQSSKSFANSGAAQGSKSVQQQKGEKVTNPKSAPKGGKQKAQVNSKVTKNKRSHVAKIKGLNIPATAKAAKKTSAIEKLKVKAFDQLKEKLEIAIDRSSISVPECAKLLQQITSPNLSEIFYSQPASVDEGNSEVLVTGLAGKSLPEIITDGMKRTGNLTNMKESATEKPITKEENAVAENLSEAAHALVSFKIQTASANSRIHLDQEAPSSAGFGYSSTPVTQAMVKDRFQIKNGNNLTDSGFPDQQFVKNGRGNRFDGAMSVPRQTVKDLSSKTALIQAKVVEETSAQSTNGAQSTSNQALQTSNLQAVSHGLVVRNDPLVKSSITESSASGWSSSSPLVPLTNQLLQMANPLVPATNPFLRMTTSLTPTTNQVLSTINPLLPTTNEAPTANQLLQANSARATTHPLIPTTNQLLSSFPNVSAIPTSASKTDTTTLVAISPGLPVVQAPNVLVNQPQLAFQLLQAQRTSPTMPTVMATTQTQSNPRFICPNPTTFPRNTTPNQEPTTLLTAPLNQRLFLPKMTSPVDLLLPKTVAAHVTGTVPTTSINEIPNSCKLRPILPREPLVSPTFTLFNPPLQSLQNVVKATDTSSNVKQAVKRLVNARTKNTDNPSRQQTTSLPDIASTFNKGFFTANSPRNVGPMMAPAQNTEMANKEQAIKALLSIGSEQQTVQQGTKGTATNVFASKEIEPRKPDDLLVVFDTDKGIFKVDDVTIDPQVNTIGKESYTCGKCGKIFTSLSYLARHIKRVCPDMTHRKWKCDLCEKAFRHPFGLQQHVFTHTGERPHKCSQCPKAFYSSNDLRRHSRIHSGERPYKCKHCGKTFATTISLKTHTFIHTGEKPHRCPHCPKTFATSSKLGRHIVTHSEQRPFACSQCPKTFNRSGDLRRHNLNLHQGKLSVEGVDEKPDTKKILNVPQETISNISEQKIQ